jgi:4-hydroxyphenylpyruvate dioxygenase-like putative hemolysin
MAKFTPWDNPMGTDGFEFIEFAAPDPASASCSRPWASRPWRGTATRT